MASPDPLPDTRQAEKFEGRVIICRFTDQLKGRDQLERSTQAAQAEIDDGYDEETDEQKKLKLLFQSPANSSAS
jgi:hypothetical protein